VAKVRPSDDRSVEELRRALDKEPLPSLTSYFERAGLGFATRRLTHDALIKVVATHVSAHHSRVTEAGETVEELIKFFERPLGGRVAHNAPSKPPGTAIKPQRRW
jgi:predicted thioesterase